MAGRITWAHTLYTALLGLWLGTFVTIGALVVPTLFTVLAGHTAIETASALFRLQGFIGFIVLGVLFATRLMSGLRELKLEVMLLATVLLSSVLLHFWVIPEMLAQRASTVKEPMWHLASSTLYLVQAVCVLWVFIQRLRTPTLTVPTVSRPSIQQTPPKTDAAQNESLSLPASMSNPSSNP